MGIARPSRRWHTFAIVMAVGAIASGCASPSTSDKPSPASGGSGASGPSAPASSPTAITAGQAPLPTVQLATPIAAASGLAAPATPASSASSQGGSVPPSASAIEVSGTYESKLDITSHGSSGSTHTAVHETGRVTATGASDGTLTGSATYTYRKDYEIGSPGCKAAWSTGDVTWVVAVTGTWQTNADGSVVVSLLPSVSQGPGIPENYICVANITEHPDAMPFGGTLVKGTFDVRQDYLPAGSGTGTDFSWATWHLELTPGP